MNLSPAPTRESFNTRGLISGAWLSWFAQVYKILRAVSPSVSADRGDASITIKAGEDALTQVFATALTAPRTVALSSVNAYPGAFFKVLRKTSATGASGLDVGGLKTLAVGTWCQVVYDGTNWILSAYGSL